MAAQVYCQPLDYLSLIILTNDSILFYSTQRRIWFKAFTACSRPVGLKETPSDLWPKQSIPVWHLQWLICMCILFPFQIRLQNGGLSYQDLAGWGRWSHCSHFYWEQQRYNKDFYLNHKNIRSHFTVRIGVAYSCYSHNWYKGGDNSNPKPHPLLWGHILLSNFAALSLPPFPPYITCRLPIQPSLSRIFSSILCMVKE